MDEELQGLIARWAEVAAKFKPLAKKEYDLHCRAASAKADADDASEELNRLRAECRDISGSVQAYLAKQGPDA